MGTILFEMKEQVAVITLNRPEKFNAFNREMALQLQATLDQCADAACRAVLITGAGKAFCSGQDLGEVVDPQGPGMQRILKEHYNPIICIHRRNSPARSCLPRARFAFLILRVFFGIASGGRCTRPSSRCLNGIGRAKHTST